MAGVLLTVSLVSAGTTVPVLAEEETTLVYGSGDYTRINPAMDEHGEINILIFNGLTAHDGDNQVVPGLAESWDFDDATNTYTFHMAEGLMTGSRRGLQARRLCRCWWHRASRTSCLS